MKKILAALALLAFTTSAHAVDTSYDLQISLFWTERADADLRVKVPGVEKPIDFKNRRSGNAELLRDELVLPPDGAPPPPIYFEMVTVSDAKPGEYIINVKGYRVREDVMPLRVTVVVERITLGRSVRRIAQATVDVKRTFEEYTAISFTLNENASVVPGTESQEFKLLATSKVPDESYPTNSMWIAK